MQPLVEGLQRAFTADGIAKENREKVNHFVVSEASPPEAHALTELTQDALLAQMLNDEHDFLEYIIMPLSLIVLLVEAIREAGLHLLLSSIPSRACLWPGARL